MGNDGGSIPTRRELVKEAARNPSTTQLKETQNEQQQYHWSSCPLSHQPLMMPIVSDSSGVLYNKSSVLESLIEAANSLERAVETENDEAFKLRVRSLRDVVDVKFQLGEDSEPEKPGMVSRSKWVCPITKKLLGPGVKAVYLVPCGHAFLESVIKEMPGEDCLQCNEPYTPDNVISILPISVLERERLHDRIQRLKQEGLTHSLKKATGAGKKRKKNPPIPDVVTSDQKYDGQRPEIHQANNSVLAAQGRIKNEETASLTAKVLAEEQDRNKRRKMGTNENLKSLFSSKNGMDEKHTDFMTRGFSIPAGAKR